FIPKKNFIPDNGIKSINGIKSEFIPKTEKSIKCSDCQKIIQPELEKELLTELEPNNLTDEEKQIALKVIQTITNKRPKDKDLRINYHVLYSQPNEEDKEGIIAKLQEENKLNKKIISEYMFLKENYYSQIVQLKEKLQINIYD